MRLPTKPRQLPTSTPTLPSFFDKLHAGGDHFLAGGLAADDLEQPHHVRRAEEVSADDRLRAARSPRRSRRCRAWRCCEARIASGLARRGRVRRRPASSAPCLRRPLRRRCRPPRSRRRSAWAGCSARRSSICCWREAALLHGVGVVLADGRQPAVERRLVGFLQQDRNAGVGEDHGDAAAHRARADDRRRVDRNDRACPCAMSGILATSRSPKKTWMRRLRLVGEEALAGTASASTWQPSSNGSLAGGFDGVDGRQGRDQVALLLARCSRAAAKIGAFCSAVPSFCVALARFAEPAFAAISRAKATAPAADRPRSIDRRCRAFERIGALTGFALGAHLNRFGDAGEPGQTLRARSARGSGRA